MSWVLTHSSNARGAYGAALRRLIVLQRHSQPAGARRLSRRILVHKDAQKTSAKQTNRDLLLNDDAQIDTKPQLEIYADDVKCTHGATIGQIEENIADSTIRRLKCDAEHELRLTEGDGLENHFNTAFKIYEMG